MDDDAGATVETLVSIVTDAARRRSTVDALPTGPTAQTGPTEPTATQLPGVGTVIAERYLLERLLGQGGMGAVFAGRHVVTGRRVAIKLLREDPIRNRAPALRMAREARAVGRIQHPNVVAVHDAGFAGDRPFIAMELLDGESLEQRIERTGPMSEAEAVRTLQQIALGVAAAHANGIIHRDLKPANVLLCRADGAASELVKVVDFGISKLRDDAEEDMLVTSQGEQIGTPVFMSPEQVRGDTLDERTDVYALSVILYYTLTQRFPFHARRRAELFAKILTAPPEPLAAHRPGVSHAIAEVVLKGLARERASRYESVSALADALSRASSERPRARSVSFTSRAVFLTAAVGGIALALVPTRLMHAAQPNQEVVVTVSATSESMATLQPPAAIEQAALPPEPEPEPDARPARPKARRPRSSTQLSQLRSLPMTQRPSFPNTQSSS